MLKNFYEDLKAEWILQGNLAEDFKDKGCKFVIILDNASFHKKAETLQKIASEMPNLIIEFLPKYSPDYNLVELVWHSAKEYVANRLFESIEKLESLLHKLLNEGGLIMKWNRKIKIKVTWLMLFRCRTAYIYMEYAVWSIVGRALRRE
ncbi:transposase [Oscillatoria nigro-viridis]|uniref:transposase n=1 Tax=Phormidium nigroviride TaxID=482564 RepID=UPI00030733CC